MLVPRVLGPAPRVGPMTQPALRAVSRSALAVVAATQADLIEENLVDVLSRDGSAPRCAWLRLGRLDARPDHLARSFAHSIGTLGGDRGPVPLPSAAASPIERRDLARVGGELAAAAPIAATVVVDSDRSGVDLADLLALISGWLAPGQGRRAVVVWHRRVPCWARRQADLVLGAGQLSIAGAEAGALAEAAQLPLSPGSIEGLVRMARGRAAIVHLVLGRLGRHHPEVVADLLARRRRPPRLLGHLARRLLLEGGPEVEEAMSVALDLGYWHPSMSADAAPAAGRPGPLLLPLAEGWYRFPRGWARPLARQLRSRPPIGELRSAAVGRRPVASGPLVATAYTPASSPAPTPPPAPLEVGCEREAPDPPQLQVRLLGGFEVAVDGRPVPFRDGPRGVLLFKFLLAHHPRPQPRDVLMDVFWPGVEPEQARNRLHVALSGLRRSLRSVVDVPVIEHQAGTYQLSAAVTLRLDTDRFERSVGEGREAEAAGSTDAAIERYERAVQLYRGDFLLDDPYEDWALLRRETLRITYLDTLDRLTALYLAHDRIGECIATAQFILHQDVCREDAHRLLMRCYAHQGRIHQVVRQYELCTRALESTLGSRPSKATTELYRSLRAAASPPPGAVAGA